MKENICLYAPDLADTPIFAVDGNLRLIFANEDFKAAVDSDKWPVENHFFREIFDDLSTLFIKESFKKAAASDDAVEATVPTPESASQMPEPFHPGARFKVLHVKSDNDQKGECIFVGKSKLPMPEEIKSLKYKARFLSLIEELKNTVLFMTDSSGSLTYLSDAIEHIMGYPPDHFVGTYAYKLVYEDDVKDFIQILVKTREGFSGTAERVRMLHRDGSILHFALNYGPCIEDDGTFGGVVGIARHITDLEKPKDQEREYNLEMLRGIAEGIAGDFNGILVGLVGNISLMKAQVSSDDALWSPIERIDTATQRAVDLTQQLMATARGGKGRTKIVNAIEIIQKAVENSRRMVDEDVEIQLTTSTDELNLAADPSYMKQLAGNLLQNAWEAMPGGGVIQVRVTDKKVRKREIPGLTEGDYLVLTIIDEGIGIDDKDMPHIYEPFFTTKSMRRGLGLSAVHGIVTEMKGAINIKSVSSEGAEVSVYLPLPKVKTAEKARTGVNLVGTSVLVVDDEPLVRDFCKAALGRIGVDVHAAAGGKEALKIFSEDPDKFDLIILDLVMPGMSGEEIFLEMKKLNAQVKVAFCSGHGGLRDELEEKGLMDQALAYLNKPFDLGQIISLVNDIAKTKGL